MKIFIKHVVVQVLMGALASGVHAGTVVCSGTVEQLAYHQPGQLMLRLSSMNVPVFFCSTDTEWSVAGSLSGTTSPSACKALYATFLAAKANQVPIGTMYFDGDQVPAACNSFVDWTKVNVRYYNY